MRRKAKKEVVKDKEKHMQEKAGEEEEDQKGGSWMWWWRACEWLVWQRKMQSTEQNGDGWSAVVTPNREKPEEEEEDTLYLMYTLFDNLSSLTGK